MAAEMQRDDWFRVKKIPLLIGGATTSRVHTAVKIAPHYEGPVVYVPDASRSVGVCTRPAVSDERAAKYIAELNADYARVRELHASKKATPLVTLAAGARQQDAASTGPPTRRRCRSSSAAACSATTTWPSWPPASTGRPFFQTWDLAGQASPTILRDEVVGDEAQRVFSDGKRLLQRADRRPLAAGQRRDRRCCRRTRWTTTHRGLHRRVAQRGADALARRCACRPSGRWSTA